MKKSTLLVAAALAGLTLAPAPLQAQAAPVYVVQIGSSCDYESNCPDELKDFFENCQLDNCQIVSLPALPENIKDLLCGNKLPDLGENNPSVDTPNGDFSNEDTTNGNSSNGIIETPDSEDNEDNEEASSDYNTYVLRVVELVNEARAEAGLKPVTLQADVTAAAQVRARETVTLFSHTRPNGTSCFTALDEAGVSYRGAGENIAWGQKTPEEVMNGWMNSAGHRANILNPSFTTIGVGFYQNESGINYWTQLFTY